MQPTLQGQGQTLPGPYPLVLRDHGAPFGRGEASPLGRRRGAVTPPPLFALPLPIYQTGRLFASLLPLAAAGRNIYCIDGGNGFDPYRLATLARAEGLDPADVLGRVFVSRAYTCHQLASAVETMLEPLAAEPAPPVVGLLGLDRLFLDDDISLYERRYIFERIMTHAERHHDAGLPLFITYLGDAASPWARRLARTALMLPDARRAVADFRERLTHHGTHAADLQSLPRA